ncbi:DEAD/DEAH box helicase [Haloactinomyces albus]|uniref:ATP-dependent helicase YprA (DUF1998 family)/rubrerythrin n=1 Tax=Haloactinomyces albus TaxID=1352928 RepID=A0AAE4CN83_9ACTN|nr:DEAD/DEAH box helicase [Haloactinomyces albus]MDR7304210.1 ATP-dependent helicase YprA (DUF1998 family)/rubrerythrin [Haloactinomyces albus]
MTTFNPLDTSSQINEAYRRYLRSLLPLRDTSLATALDETVDNSSLLTKGPLLESTPAYEPGATITELVDEEVLSPEFFPFTGPELPADRPLHRHQEQAVRKARAGRNFVMATGTGSGKTEGFLLPILAHLAEQRAAGALGPGVRALLLYPMNALANDQLARFRRLLATMPDVTFGRYTGDTREDRRKAEEDFRNLNPGVEPLPNELLSRQEMRANPPHLLLTNYAMLEYLLLRPQDMDLFDTTHAQQWKFIVVDEAHVYDGAKGSELAMLLRRLRDRVGANHDLQAIATSATVGADSAPEAVTDFATNLFGLPFHWESANPDRQDLVTASTLTHPAGPAWGPLPSSAYAELATVSDPQTELLRMARAHGWHGHGQAADALRTEARLRKLHTALSKGPQPLENIATELFTEHTDDDRTMAEVATTNLVTLAGLVHDPAGSPVLSTRFHLFTRATEGAFSCLTETDPHLSLSRREQCEHCFRRVFELAGCRRCGTVYLHGAMDNSGPVPRHTPWRSGVDRSHAWLLLEDRDIDGTAIEDEDDALLDGGKAEQATRRYLCIGCGTVHTDESATCSHEDCPGTELRAVRLINSSSESLKSCIACGARGTRPIRLLESGSEAAASVLATSFYQALPPDTTGPAAEHAGQGRKLLFFSDSRQMAAYFAPYLQDTHQRLSHRRLIMLALQHWAKVEDNERATVEDVVDFTLRATKRSQTFHEDDSRSTRRNAVSLWVMQETISYDDRQSLEGVGLIRVELDRKPTWQPPERLTALGLGTEESWGLLEELLRILRTQGALDMPEEVDPSNEEFAPRRGPIYVRGQGSDSKKRVFSWVPTRGTNRRADYLTRVLRELGSDRDPNALLDELWQDLDPANAQDGPQKWFRSDSFSQLGTVRRIDHRKLRFRQVDEATVLYQCDRCRRIAGVSVRGVCSTMRCDGTLQPWQRTSAEQERDHYRHLYLASSPVPMRVQEHTAQWTSKKAAEIQTDFVQGKTNALSCSTTFELGVDVGELQAVMLRNMPPTTANYVQRAGRAGRRTDSAALVVTYAQRRSHDLSRFAEPEKMISGETRAPVIPLENVRIDRRHAHSIALAAFFRAMRDQHQETWRTAGEFFLAPAPAPPDHVIPALRVRNFLTPVPAAVRASLETVLPKNMHEEIGVATDAWVEVLVDLLETARSELQQDVDAFEQRRKTAEREQKYPMAEQCKKVLRTLYNRPLIGFLANHNVLPKYGFPVDTVELRTNRTREDRDQTLELTRDLSLAIKDYAPGAEIIAGGHRWTSGGIYRLPGRDLVTRYYAVCEECGHYRESIDQLDPTCPSCHAPQTRAARHYVEPTYGFVASEAKKQGSSQAPPRSGSTATYILDSHADVDEGTTRFPGGGTLDWRVGARGQFVVISEGAGRAGFRICQWCGWGISATQKSPREHPHLLKDTTCTGPLIASSLAHRYETDFVELRFDPLTVLGNPEENFRSAVYALLEGASVELEISRDDIDGTVHRGVDGQLSLVLFDTTPGGAGSTLRIAQNLIAVVRTAVARVIRCECGAETSCYGCLRGFSNERYHEQLSRSAALELLQKLVPSDSGVTEGSTDASR